jgi:hypothetical protein
MDIKRDELILFNSDTTKLDTLEAISKKILELEASISNFNSLVRLNHPIQRLGL